MSLTFASSRNDGLYAFMNDILHFRKDCIVFNILHWTFSFTVHWRSWLHSVYFLSHRFLCFCGCFLGYLHLTRVIAVSI